MSVRAEPGNAVRECTRCILDTADDPQMTFDEGGVCSHCRSYEQTARARGLSESRRQERLDSLLRRIKDRGRGRDYDCVVGISGGGDSTYVAYLAKQFGLRALAVHCDNGWNSELAVNNIENILKTLGFDLYTYVIDWDEFRDIQLAYLRASVVDIEAISDHAINATLYLAAAREGVKFILTGDNLATEGMMPSHWVHNKNDLINLRAIHRLFGNLPMKTFPTLGLRKQFYYQRVLGIERIGFLDLVPYNKEDAKRAIAAELGWRDYGGKHYESVFTRFYQSYILPVKFGIDKRKFHLSTLICSGQIGRDEALRIAGTEVIDPDLLNSDRDFVLKKLGLSAEEFERTMWLPIRNHTDYPSVMRYYAYARVLKRLARRALGIVVGGAPRRRGEPPEAA